MDETAGQLTWGWGGGGADPMQRRLASYSTSSGLQGRRNIQGGHGGGSGKKPLCFLNALEPFKCFEKI
jgi:hypothetical protein